MATKYRSIGDQAGNRHPVSPSRDSGPIQTGRSHNVRTGLISAYICRVRTVGFVRKGGRMDIAESGTCPGASAGMQSEWWPTNDPTGRSVREFRLIRGGSERPVTGALWSPAIGRGSARPLVLFGHGASGDRYQAPICHLAARFVRAGFSALAIDGPVHGLRQVGPGGREALADEMRRETYIDDMVDDWLAALGAARGTPRGP